MEKIKGYSKIIDEIDNLSLLKNREIDRSYKSQYINIDTVDITSVLP